MAESWDCSNHSRSSTPSWGTSAPSSRWDEPTPPGPGVSERPKSKQSYTPRNNSQFSSRGGGSRDQKSSYNSRDNYKLSTTSCGFDEPKSSFPPLERPKSKQTFNNDNQSQHNNSSRGGGSWDQKSSYNSKDKVASSTTSCGWDEPSSGFKPPERPKSKQAFNSSRGGGSWDQKPSFKSRDKDKPSNNACGWDVPTPGFNASDRPTTSGGWDEPTPGFNASDRPTTSGGWDEPTPDLIPFKKHNGYNNTTQDVDTNDSDNSLYKKTCDNKRRDNDYLRNNGHTNVHRGRFKNGYNSQNDESYGDSNYPRREGRGRGRATNDSDGGTNYHRGRGNNNNYETANSSRYSKYGNNSFDSNRGRFSNRNRGNRSRGNFNRNLGSNRPQSGFDNCADSTKKDPIITIRQLDQLLEKDPDEMMLSLNAENSGFMAILKENNIPYQSMVIIIELLANACYSTQKRNLALLMEMVNSSIFLFVHIPKFMFELKMTSQQGKYTNSIPYLIRYLSAFQENQPATACENVSILIPQIRSVLERLVDQHYEFELTVLDDFSQLESENERLMSIYCDKDRKKKAEEEKQHAKDPPTNFRDISIYPTEEDLNSETPPFLRCNVVHGKYMDVEHYLDVQFRLLREDFVQPLREGINEFQHLSKNNQKFKRIRELSVYFDVHITHSVCSILGIQHMIKFDNKRFRNVDWMINKRFMGGSLLCLSSDNFKTMIFACVGKRDELYLKEGLLLICFEERTERINNISPNEEFVMVETPAFFEAYRHNLRALQSLDERCFPMKNYIVDVNKNIEPPKYLKMGTRYDLRPLLLPFPNTPKTLKDNKKMDEFPPITQFVSEIKVLDPSAWPLHDDFKMELSQFRALKTALTKEFSIIQGPPGTGKTYIGLRVVQALIQNENLWNCNRDSPMLIVCFTNHALDQFLEGILNITSNIVRVGGRSISVKLEEFRLINKRLNMRKSLGGNHYSNSKGKALKRNRYQCTTQLLVFESKVKVAENDINRACQDALTEKDLEAFMKPDHYNSLTSTNGAHNDGLVILDWLELRFRGQEISNILDCKGDNNDNDDSDDGDTKDVSKHAKDVKKPDKVDQAQNEHEDIFFDDPTVDDMYSDIEREIEDELEKEHEAIKSENSKREEGDWALPPGWKARKKKIEKQMSKIKKTMAQEEVDAILDVWKLPLAKRWALYNVWASEYIKSKYKDISNFQDRFDEQLIVLKELRHLEDLELMQNCSVVGMTTTGAAKYQDLVRDLKPKIVIVEEAAEVLEAHIITALSKDTQQLIMIGDHQQLRPNPASYSLAKDYNLNISLFERMVENGMPCQQLIYQHRMRPCISSLLVPTIYSVLENYPNVSLYEDVKGIKNNMYFITHDYVEGNEEDSHSKSNIHEATFLIKLARYFVQQGYKQSEITILSTYSGQCNSITKLKKELQLNDIVTTSVDNYQGEENEIVLVSLVRSNCQGSIGFLDVSNRVCVALSRAKKGLYCIGNMRLLAKNSELWDQLEQKFDSMNAIGVDLRLYCQNHPDTYKDVSRENDFDSVPEGGCTRPCMYRLQCGHVCKLCCHSYDRLHELFICKEKCNKITCAKKHKCPKICSQCTEDESCGPCIVRVKKELKCGHEVMVPCSTDYKENKCPMTCSKPLKCGHLCTQPCGEMCETKCKIQVNKIGLCGHSILAPCCISNEPFKLIELCEAPCKMELTCGDICVGKCGTCVQGRFHVPCLQVCARLLVCGHQCTEPCSATCPPCRVKCESRCEHSQCPKTCGIPCQPCRMPCKWSCIHHRCRAICSDLCDRPPCKKPCPKLLLCKHPCIGYCGEPCPNFCRICDEKQVTEIIFGTEDNTEARFIKLDCSHIFESEALVKWAFEFSESDQVIRMLRCPTCQKVIHHNHWLQKIIKTVLKGIEKVKEKVYGLQQENSKKHRDLKVYLNSLTTKVVSEFKKPLSTIEFKLHERNLDAGKLAAFKNFLIFIERLDKADSVVWKCKDQILNETVVYNLSVTDHLANIQTAITKFILKSCNNPNQQQAFDLEKEVKRFETVAHLLFAVHEVGGFKCLKKEGIHKLNDTLALLLSPKPILDDSLVKIKHNLNDLKKLYGATVLGVSVKERKEIVRAIGLSQGHWYQCPNGHVYCIGECGGATVIGRCNECNSKIGGENHSLTDGNMVASLMDGAHHPAWSEAANLANFDPAEFIDD